MHSLHNVKELLTINLSQIFFPSFSMQSFGETMVSSLKPYSFIEIPFLSQNKLIVELLCFLAKIFPPRTTYSNTVT